MHKSPASMRGALATKSSAKKVDVVSVGCQTESAYNTDCAIIVPTEDMPEMNGMDASSNAADQRTASAISPTTKDKQQMGTSENTSEGTIIMTIGKFSTLSDTMCSGPKRVQGVPWRIMVMPKQHVVQKKQQKCMGFFLQCCPEKVYSDAWSCKADAEMRLMSKKPGVTNFVRKTSHMYTSKENDWGYSCFMTWADVLDENQGYIKDDKITLEITVKAEAPKNLMSREEFMKAIDQWYNLAEMQMTRGMIDLSLEANAQGLKFCKDKDEEMKAKLEEQKQRLVKKKVLDSISRIENHGGQPKTSEPLKPTSLRQALTGAQKNMVSSRGKVITNKRDRKATLQQIKKKKQENAIKPNAQQYKTESEGERSGSSPTYSPSSPQYDSHSDTDVQDIHYCKPQNVSDGVNDFSCYPTLDAAELSTDEDVDGDDEDDSDYYNEDEEAIENQLTDQEESLHDSTSSLDESLNYKVDMGCQTLFTGGEQMPHPQQQSQPQPNPRRERMHIILTSHNSGDGDFSDCASAPEYQHPAGSPGSTTEEVSAYFADEIADEYSDLYRKRNSGQDVTPQDYEKIDQWCIQHFGDVSKDLSICALTIGLCTVTSRRCAEAGRDFRKLISDTFKDEYKLAAKLLVENERQIARIRAVQAGISEVMQKHDMPPGDFQLDLAEDTASGHKTPRKVSSKENLQIKQDCDGYIKEVMQPDVYKNVLYPISECEKSVEQLAKDIGHEKFDVCIAEKLQDMMKTITKDYNPTLVTLLTELFNYFRTLTEQKQELQQSLDVARTLFQMKTKNGGLGFKTKQVQDSEKRIAESEALVKKIGHTYQQEVEKNKKLDAQLADELNKLRTCHQQLEQLTQQLKEARNLTKKAEKKAKQEETKNASLLADKLDLEDKLKAARKEVDQLKKKSTEDRNNAKKQKDRDLETIRRLETENAEKDAEREREKGLFEDKLREARTKENKAERERKHAVGNSNAAIERARKAEAAQIELMYELCERRFEKAQEEIHVGMSEAEKNFKRAHNTQDDQDVMKKNLAEWKAASEELEKIMKETKVEYENAAEAVKKGQLLLSQFELNQPTLPALPKTIRLPPVQVVQPSTSALPPPLNIVPPPAGVIGQPRSSTSNVGVIGQPSSRSQVSGPPGMNGTISTPSFNTMKMGHGDTGPGQSLVQQQATSTNPAASLWNWSSPLENVTASVFRSSSMEHTRPQQSSMVHDSWTNHPDDFTAQALNRSMYNNHNQQSQSVNWANAPGWQRPSSANISQQSQYGRSGLPPYYQ